MPHFNYRSQFHYSYAAKAVELIAKIHFGATGAPSIVAGTGMGITSITRNSAGDYTILLDRKFNALLGLDGIFLDSTGLPAAPVIAIKADSIASAGSVEIVCSAAGTATDPASGEAMYLRILVNDSSLAY